MEYAVFYYTRRELRLEWRSNLSGILPKTDVAWLSGAWSPANSHTGPAASHAVRPG